MGTTKKQPQRQCIGCRQMKDKKSLVRIIKNEQGIMLDETGKKNGRGAYLCYDAACLEKAMKNKGLERSLKVSISQEVYQELKKEFEAVEQK